MSQVIVCPTIEITLSHVNKELIDDVCKIYEHVKKHRIYITFFNIGNSILPSCSVDLLVAFPSLNKLYIQYKTSCEGVALLINWLEENTSLEELSLSTNIMSNQYTELLSCLKGHPRLWSLNTAHCYCLTQPCNHMHYEELVDLVKHSNILELRHWLKPILSYEDELRDCLRIPLSEREIPIRSKTKSAAKII
jgi:hypothetical protein